MITSRMREPRHVLLKLAALALCLPMFAILGCTAASSGHAPGVAGGETLTPGITNFPLAYIKRPAPVANAKASQGKHDAAKSQGSAVKKVVPGKSVGPTPPVVGATKPVGNGVEVQHLTTSFAVPSKLASKPSAATAQGAPR